MLDPSVFGDQDEEDQQVEKEEQHDPVEFGAGQQQGSELIATPNAVDVVRSTMTIPGAAATVSTSTGVAIDDSNGDGLPDDPEAIAAVYRDARDRGVVADDGTVVFTPEQVQSFLHLDDEAQATRIELLVTTFTDDALILGARDALDQAASRLSAAIGPAVPTVSVSGEVIASQDSLAAFTRAMVVSLPIAVAVTVLIVGLAIRSVRYSIVTILPILLVVFGVWGYMWARGFTINPVTATIAAIAVGVGIDFCTHFTVRFKEELAHTAERLEAVRRAGEGTGGALAISALTSIAGFGVMTAAPAPIFASFGELMAIMILLSAAVALLVLPCLLVVVTRPRADVATSTLLEPTGWSADPCETTSLRDRRCSSMATIRLRLGNRTSKVLGKVPQQGGGQDPIWGFGVHTAQMTSGQRWILIVALGAGCWATASAVNSWLDHRNTEGGWFNYAPNNGAVFSPTAGNPWRGLLVWLVAILVWSGVSYLMLRRARERS